MGLGSTGRPAVQGLTRPARQATHDRMSEHFPRIEPLGEAALLLRFAPTLDDRANRACVAFRAGLEAEPITGVVETASSLGSVLVRYEGDPEALEAALTDRLNARDWSQIVPPARRLWRIPCSYGGDDGPQLEEAAAMAGLSQADAIAALSSARVRVLALGFVPGMPYTGILPPEWDLPRQTGLTPKVPEGALVTAVRQLVLFGTEAPTGWRQVGRTLFGCFNPSRDRPIALTPGDEVIFPAVSMSELRDEAAADPDRHGGATFEVLP
ncbi:MAG: carboxyltransferase domain-containing protein [Jannaschia helgolandensis]